MIVLLDLNSTLVENTAEAHRLPYEYNVSAERYRSWLVDLLRGHRVVLMTVRPEALKAETMARIEELCGWAPEMALFNRWRLSAPVAKERMLTTEVFPVYGRPENQRYLALESNVKTAAMLRRHEIRSMRQESVRAYPEALIGHGHSGQLDI